MLITFKTDSYADITMFGDAATALLKMMGMSGNVPGALMSEDIPGALESLRAALQLEVDESAAPSEEDEEDDPPVSLNTRAVPLLELLESAASAGDTVMWEEHD